MNKEFATTDICLAAVLKLQNYDMIRLDIVGTRKCSFVFANVPETLLTEYLLGKSCVEPKQFNFYIKELTTAAKQRFENKC